MRIGIRVERLVVRSSAANLHNLNDHCNGVQVQLHLRISRGAAILHPADLVNPFPPQSRSYYLLGARLLAVGIKAQQSPPTLRDSPSRWVNGYHGLNDHNQGEIEQVKIYYSSCGFNNPRRKQILYRPSFCIFIGQTAL